MHILPYPTPTSTLHRRRNTPFLQWSWREANGCYGNQLKGQPAVLRRDGNRCRQKDRGAFWRKITNTRCCSRHAAWRNNILLKSYNHSDELAVAASCWRTARPPRVNELKTGRKPVRNYSEVEKGDTGSPSVIEIVNFSDRTTTRWVLIKACWRVEQSKSRFKPEISCLQMLPFSQLNEFFKDIKVKLFSL